MEFEPRFQRHKAPGDYYRRLIEFVYLEIERSPELQEELNSFVEYITVLQRTAPLVTWLPAARRVQAVHREIERVAFPQLPVTLPPPYKIIAVGEHMDITVGESAETCWPDDSQRVLSLSDGVVVAPDMPVGRIDIARGFDRLSESTSLIGFMRVLMNSSVTSLKDLASLCKEDDNRLSGIEVFAGVSHLARIAGKFGFDVFDIANPLRRAHATDVSKSVATRLSGGNKTWNEIKRNYKPAQVAFISRNTLVHKFGI